MCQGKPNHLSMALEGADDLHLPWFLTGQTSHLYCFMIRQSFLLASHKRTLCSQWAQCVFHCCTKQAWASALGQFYVNLEPSISILNMPILNCFFPTPTFLALLPMSVCSSDAMIFANNETWCMTHPCGTSKLAFVKPCLQAGRVMSW